MTTEAMQRAELNDAELVAESLDGNRDAFRLIVERYQTLISSLAYCATGNVSRSEDLAQETFVSAWKQLAELREPAKLRPWLCSIARFLISNEFRRQGREPDHAAESLEAVDEWVSPEPLPPDQVISDEEKAILWRSLERIPEIYREPLVLFYREQQSVERVAAALDLSEDAVKQRLSRGRKLLQEQFLAFVAGALKQTSPGKTFTLGVIAALPLLATTAKAATAGAVAAKGSATAKTATGRRWRSKAAWRPRQWPWADSLRPVPKSCWASFTGWRRFCRWAGTSGTRWEAIVSTASGRAGPWPPSGALWEPACSSLSFCLRCSWS